MIDYPPCRIESWSRLVDVLLWLLNDSCQHTMVYFVSIIFLTRTSEPDRSL